MRRLLLALLLWGLPLSMAWGQAGATVNATPGSVWTYLGPTYGADWVFPPQLASAYVLNNAALAGTLPSTSQIYRAGFYTAGDGGGALYTHSATPCSLNAGVGDNGGQVRAADGGCWLLVFPASGADVRIWGADATGVADSTAAIRAAVATVAPCNILFPVGTFAVNGNIPIAHPCTVTGVGSGLSRIKVNAATGDVFTLSGTTLTPYSAITFRDFSIYSNTTRTGGAYVHCLSPNCMLSNMEMIGAAVGVVFDQYATRSIAKELSFRNTVPVSTYGKSTDILLTGGVEAVHLDTIFSDVDAATVNNMPRSCIELQWADATIISVPQLVHCQSIILVDPSLPAHLVLSTQVIGGFLDTPLAPAGQNAFALELISIAGAITRFTATGTWFGDSAHDGINFAVTGGVADGFVCMGCQLVLNGRCGANISSQNWNDIRFVGGNAVANGSANFCSVVNAHNVTISGVAQSQFGEAPSANGIILAGGVSRWTIIDNDFTGVTTPIVNPNNCANNCFIAGNTGYNPVHSGPIAFAGSPAILCSIATPETVYISGGVVTKIETQQWAGNVDTGLKSGSFALAANACLTVTYTTAPTGVRDIH